MATTKVKVQLYIFIIVFFVIPGSKNVYIDTKIIFPSDLEAEILRMYICMYILAAILENGRH